MAELGSRELSSQKNEQDAFIKICFALLSLRNERKTKEKSSKMVTGGFSNRKNKNVLLRADDITKSLKERAVAT